MFFFSLGIVGELLLSYKFLIFVPGNFYCFKNEGYFLEIFKDEFFLTELCLFIYVQSTSATFKEVQ